MLSADLLVLVDEKVDDDDEKEFLDIIFDDADDLLQVTDLWI